jgi:hypothetical protein
VSSRGTRPALALLPAAVASIALVASAAAPTQASATTLEPRSDTRPLPFIADDYARALADARARSLPLFIEAWAPW